ncbi:MAG: NADH-quinone oxidoreductase subunit C [Promethearchaeota archaeon]
MNDKMNSNNFYSIFEQYFKSDIIKKIEDRDHLIYLINELRIRDIALFFSERQLKLINISVLDFTEKFQLMYEFYYRLDKTFKFLFLMVLIDNNHSINSINHIFPQAKYYENEIEKRFGLSFKYISNSIEIEPFSIPTPFESEIKLNYYIPIGIYSKNPNLRNYFNLLCKRNKIQTVIEKTGWLYRGIIPLLSNLSFKDNVKLTKRICYISSYHHNLSYIMCLEQLMEIKVQNRVKQIRTVFCELERFESLLLWFINLFKLLKYRKMYINLMSLRNQFQNSVKTHLKIRFFDEINFIGYCKDFPNGDLLNFQLILTKLFKKVFNLIKYTVYRNHLRNRCEGIGILGRDEALNAGVTGSCLRASGINYDIRFEKPYLSYIDDDLVKEWNIVTSRNGDVFSRIETRIWEMEQTIKIIDYLITKLIDDDSEIEIFDDKNLVLPKNKIAIMQVESPQGELVYCLKTSEIGAPERFAGAIICSPSFKNFTALNNYLLKGNYKSNYNLIVHSMDLIFNEIDL